MGGDLEDVVVTIRRDGNVDACPGGCLSDLGPVLVNLVPIDLFAAVAGQCVPCQSDDAMARYGNNVLGSRSLVPIWAGMPCHKGVEKPLAPAQKCMVSPEP